MEQMAQRAPDRGVIVDDENPERVRGGAVVAARAAPVGTRLRLLRTGDEVLAGVARCDEAN